MKIKVVYNPKTNKIYDFTEDERGAIRVIYPENSLNDLIVTMVDIDRIDFENNRLIEEDHAKKTS
jgi:hypothetical protein